MLNPTITAEEAAFDAAWADHPSPDSIVQVNDQTGANITVDPSTGFILASSFINDQRQSSTLIPQDSLPLASDIDGNAQVLAVIGKSLSGTPAVTAAMNWKRFK